MPSWRIHRALAREALAGVPAELARGVLAGVVEPDVEVDACLARGRRGRRLRRARHHSPNPRLVRYYYRLALFLHRRGDLYDAGRALGRAMHYLHDGLLKTRRWLILDVHDEAEGRLEALWSRREELCRGDAAPLDPTSSPEEALCRMRAVSRALVEALLRDAARPPDRRALKAYRRAGWALAAAATATFASALLAPQLLPAPLAALTAAALWRRAARGRAEGEGLLRPQLSDCRTAM